MKFLFWILVFACRLNFLFSEEALEKDVLPDEEVLFVSLGAHCQAAGQLERLNLRKRAFPFDWLITNCHKEFLKIFTEDFNGFMDDKYLKASKSGDWHFDNTYYKISFRHEAENPRKRRKYQKFKEMIISSRTKYERRIARFRELRNFSGKVFFIRIANAMDRGYTWYKESSPLITENQAIELRDTLRQYFPSLNFTLVIINYMSANAPEIPWEPDMIEFKVNSNETFINESYRYVMEYLQLMSSIEVSEEGVRNNLFKQLLYDRNLQR